MNLKDWMKTAEDEKTVTLKHPKGHTMTIYPYALPKIQREQLKRLKMAKGGKVEGNDHLASGHGGESEQGKDIRYAHKRGGPKMDTYAAEANVNAKEEAKGRAQMERTVKPKMKGLAKGGEVENDIYDDDSGGGALPPDQSLPASQPMPMVGQEDTPPATVPNVPNAQPALNASSNLQDQSQNTLNAVAQGQQGIEAQKAVDIAKAKANEPALAQNIADQRAIAQAQSQAYREVKGHTDDFNAYIQNNPIDPKHYQESMGSGQKASTAIGLLLGGLGSAFGGHNYAQDFLDKQIDRDIAGQQQRVNNQHTIWGAYQQLYGDSNITTALAKASTNDIYAKKIEQTALQLGTPQAIANAQAAIQKLSAESEQLRMNAAGNLGGTRLGAGKAIKIDEDHILNPGANDAANTLQYNPLFKDKMPAIMEQKGKADLADKAIDTIKATFPKLYENTGGAGGYTRRFGHDLHGVPYVGGIADKAVQFATDTNKNEAYDSDYQNVIGAVRGALQGNVSEDLLNQVVEANRPETNDPKDLKEKKLRNMIDFVKSHTKTDMLEPAGLAKRR